MDFDCTSEFADLRRLGEVVDDKIEQNFLFQMPETMNLSNDLSSKYPQIQYGKGALRTPSNGWLQLAGRIRRLEEENIFYPSKRRGCQELESWEHFEIDV